ncbi:hypothetical protein Lalb_Chr02g0149701 [Lupinus albus]|uniref:Uncharacterized protein n=1 Tax=Lupinus albus TaxID=3870 RepID=A0A6A4QZ58_LUPAL|nr:hypothetical protein Lalb_Chr02g0149701 [Lupinus albus]
MHQQIPKHKQQIKHVFWPEFLFYFKKYLLEKILYFVLVTIRKFSVLSFLHQILPVIVRVLLSIILGFHT